MGSLIRPTDFSAILASRSGNPVASDARAHVGSHRDEGWGGWPPLPAPHGRRGRFCIVASLTAEDRLSPSHRNDRMRTATAQRSACVYTIPKNTSSSSCDGNGKRQET